MLIATTMLTLATAAGAWIAALDSEPPLPGDAASITDAWQTQIVEGRRLDLYGEYTTAPARGSELTQTPPRVPVDQIDSQPLDCGPLNRCDDFTVSLLPQATIADVASFAPQPAALTSDPAGYAVVGLPVDFAVTASAHSASGTLFDLPVTVRFTPEEIVITTGDGSALTTPSTPTATSHVYRDRGTYVASATVRYRAEVDFGRGWRPVPGTLDIPTAGYAVQVLEARGTLVERTCAEPPLGPGC